MKTKSKNLIKSDDYRVEQIKENCVVEFLCLLTNKPTFSIKTFFYKLKKLFKK